MKNKYWIIILIALLALPLTPTLAANEVTFSEDTTLDMVSPDANITVLANSIVDSLTTGDSTITVVISTGGLLTLRSMDKYTLTSSANSDIEVDAHCRDSYYEVIATPESTASSDELTITIGSTKCSANAAGSANYTPGGSSSNSSSSSPAPATTPIVETPVTPLDLITPTPITADVSVPQYYTTPATPGVPETDAKGMVTLAQLTNDAVTVASGSVNDVIALMVVARNTAAEDNYGKTVVAGIVKGAGATAAVSNTITNFVTYGTPATKILGGGERAGVVNSYLSAFGKLPTTIEEWNDVIKIANGRWPSARSETKEAKAKTSFKTIYLREANMNNAHDNAAVTVMSYGLRPANRNLNSEKAAIKSFKAIFGFNPSSASNWDAVRAVAYSGATR